MVTMSMGTGLPGFCGGELVDVALDALDQFRVGLRKIRSAGRGCVVSVARRRGPGMKVLVGGKALCEQLGADHLAVLQNQASGGLVRKQHGRDAGDHQRIAKAEQDRGHKREENRCLPDGMHFKTPSK